MLRCCGGLALAVTRRGSRMQPFAAACDSAHASLHRKAGDV